jgi:MFS family permease
VSEVINGETPGASSLSSLWKNSDFLKLWSAEGISVLGDQFTGLAIPLIAVLTLKATPAQMGILTAAGLSPYLFISLHVGVWVDRLPRRPILMIADFGRVIILLTVPIAAVAGHLTMLQLYIVELLAGMLSVFFGISYQAILPALVDRKQLVEGNGKLQAAESVGTLVGPSIAGAVIQALSAPVAIILDAISFVISGGVISLIKAQEPNLGTESQSPILTEICEGLSLVFNNEYLRSIAGCTGTLNLGNGAYNALYILFLTRDLALGPAKIGIIMSIGSIAGIFGAIVAGNLGHRLGFGPVIIGSAFLIAFGILPIAFATPHSAVPILILAGLIGSFMIPVYNVNQVSLRQAITPHRLQGRMNATMRFLVVGTMPIGGLIGGALGGTIGLRDAIAVTGAIKLLSFIWILFSPVRGLRAIPEPVD